MILYRTPGRSFTRPPRTSTIECSCRLCPTPGMYAVTSIWLVSRTRATLRSAEFGFLGVVVYTRVHTPRRPPRSGVSPGARDPADVITPGLLWRAAGMNSVGARTSYPGKPGTRGKSTDRADAGQNGGPSRTPSPTAHRRVTFAPRVPALPPIVPSLCSHERAGRPKLAATGLAATGPAAPRRAST